MKRFFSLMLAVLLLVSAMSVTAFATDNMVSFYIQLWVDGECVVNDPVSVPAGTVMDQATVQLYATNHLNGGAYFGEGYKIVETSGLGQEAVNFGGAAIHFETAAPSQPETPSEPEAPVDPCEGGHAWGKFEVTKEATCKEAGEKVRVCANNAEHKDVQPIAKLTGADVHDYEDGVCTVCGGDKVYKLTFIYDGGIKTVEVVNGETYKLPTVELVDGHRIEKWVGDKGDEIDGDDRRATFHIGKSTTYKAEYYETNDDGLVDLDVYAYYYVDGELHHKEYLFTEKFEESRKSSMVTWLYGSTEGVAAVREALDELEGADGYQWYPNKFYNLHGDGEVTGWDDLKANGNKAVYVKVESKKAIEATILLHIHTAKEYAIARTVKMAGYTAGDFVSYNEALAKVKNYYTGSSMEMSDLYDEGDWEDLMDGLKSSGSKTIKVEDNGTTEIHVIVENATSKTSSNADTSNPKTGDYITIAVGTMVMAAAALVTLTELKKRKMI